MSIVMHFLQQSRVFWLLALVAGCSGSSWSSCPLLDSNLVAEDLHLDLGQISFSANKRIGDVIMSRGFPIQSQLNWGGCDQSAVLMGKILSAQASKLDTSIFNTNIEGVGIRLSQRFASQRIEFPYQHPINGQNDLAGGRLQVELIKTADQIGSGVLNIGNFASIYLDKSGPSKPLLNIILSGSGNSLVPSSCIIDEQSREQFIDLMPIRLGEMKAVGSTAHEQRFNIQLSCPQSYQVQKLKLGFKYNVDTHHAAANVIANQSSASAAKGVGLQILTANQRTVIANGEKVAIEPVSAQAQPSLDLIARYYQTQQRITAGEVRSTITFNIDYQ
ncbi:type 1 fimbria pilin [Acinetobacter calcoaceticus]|uniref:Type 1 fimbria pilin n=1 Tax=Acinetobacter calcoaceticus TaxID=471 RepID=A0A4R1Y3G7_ACICA|nr:type 1 fimbria pilin [Acinetobacter calcoaceticus]